MSTWRDVQDIQDAKDKITGVLERSPDTAALAQLEEARELLEHAQSTIEAGEE